MVSVGIILEKLEIKLEEFKMRCYFTTTNYSICNPNS